MADDSSKGSMTSLEQILIAAAVFGVVTAVTLWLLLEHQAEASGMWKKATGKVMQWLD